MGKLKSIFSQFKKPWKGCLGLETAPESLPPTVEVKISAHERPLLLHRRQRPRKQPQLSLELPEASNSGACWHHSIHSDAWSFWFQCMPITVRQGRCSGSSKCDMSWAPWDAEKPLLPGSGEPDLEGPLGSLISSSNDEWKWWKWSNFGSPIFKNPENWWLWVKTFISLVNIKIGSLIFCSTPENIWNPLFSSPYLLPSIRPIDGLIHDHPPMSPKIMLRIIAKNLPKKAPKIPKLP